VLTVYVDADACPVKPEVYRVAQRYGLDVVLVANAYMNVPRAGWLRLVVVEEGPDAADDWIAGHVETDDVVITGDFPLAARCLDRGASVLGLRGQPFTADNIGDALATRHLLTQLRDQGLMMGGPSAFSPKDRSRFLQSLDEMINAIRRRQAAD